MNKSQKDFTRKELEKMPLIEFVTSPIGELLIMSDLGYLQKIYGTQQFGSILTFRRYIEENEGKLIVIYPPNETEASWEGTKGWDPDTFVPFKPKFIRVGVVPLTDEERELVLKIKYKRIDGTWVTQKPLDRSKRKYLLIGK